MTAFASIILIGLLSIGKSQECRGIYENGNPVQPLGVCLEQQAELSGSTKFACNDDGDPVMELYATADCSLVSHKQDIPVSFDSVICDEASKRCPYATIRRYTTTDCAESNYFIELTVVVGYCNAGVMYECSDTEVTQKIYASTSCEDTPTETITVHKTDNCDAGFFTIIEECNTDKSIQFYTTATIFVAFIVTLLV